MTKDRGQRPPTIVMWWLSLIAVIIGIMVTIGGATRLTDSGLSIVEWDLVKGALPPLTPEAWEEAFAEYRTIPEYELVNAGMSLADFKEIFWWEWGHRQLGRFIGLAYLLPLIWFSLRGMVRGGLRLRLWGIFALISLQGALGWYMVSSGLSDRVDVSQYRLALHLGTAFLLFGLIVWQAEALWQPPGRAAAGKGLSLFAKGLVLASFVQVILGAFVAGLRAGFTYNTWPLMDGRFFPDGYFLSGGAGLPVFENIAAVQFNHRMGAYILLGLAFGFAVACWRAGGRTRARGVAVFLSVTAQAVLGIWTLLAAVPLPLGLLHQIGALIVFTVTIWAAYGVTPRAHPKAAT